MSGQPFNLNFINSTTIFVKFSSSNCGFEPSNLWTSWLPPTTTTLIGTFNCVWTSTTQFEINSENFITVSITGSRSFIRLFGLNIPSKQSPNMAIVISSYIMSSCSIFLSNSHNLSCIISKLYTLITSLYIPLISNVEPAWKSLKQIKAVEPTFKAFKSFLTLISIGFNRPIASTILSLYNSALACCR